MAGRGDKRDRNEISSLVNVSVFMQFFFDHTKRFRVVLPVWFFNFFFFIVYVRRRRKQNFLLQRVLLSSNGKRNGRKL